MSNVVYLKKEDILSDIFICYVHEERKSIITYDDQCTIKKFDDLEDFNFDIQDRFKIGYNLCDKSEFDQALNNFEATLNEIKEQL